MIYRYYGIRRTSKQVWKNVLRFNWGTFVSELGIDLVQNGFDVTFTGWHSDYFPAAYRKASRYWIISDLQRRAVEDPSEDRKNVYRSLARFMELGGQFKPGIPSWEDVKQAVNSANPPCLCIEQNCLYKVDIEKHPCDSGHFVIPVGFKDKKVAVNDPYWETTKQYWVSEEKLLFAWYSWRGLALFIKPKNSRAA